MKLSEINNYLLDRIGEYSVETKTEGHYLTIKPGKAGFMAYVFGDADSLYEVLKEYEIKYIYVKDEVSLGICFQDSALMIIRSLGTLCNNSNTINYTSREIHEVEEIEEESPTKHATFDPFDVDLPF